MAENNSQPPQIRVTRFNDQQSLTQGLKSQSVAPRTSRRWVWVILAASTLVVLAALGLFFYSQHQLKKAESDLAQQKNDPAAKIKDENKQLVAQVGKLIILPTDEDPTIATVSDLDKLKNQPFFAKAQLGDKVLIYSVAKKAILYRPTENKIIELAPLVDNQPAELSGSAPATITGAPQ